MQLANPYRPSSPPPAAPTDEGDWLAGLVTGLAWLAGSAVLSFSLFVAALAYGMQQMSHGGGY